MLALAALCLAGCSSQAVSVERLTTASPAPSNTAFISASVATAEPAQTAPVPQASPTVERATETPQTNTQGSTTATPGMAPPTVPASQRAYGSNVQVATSDGVKQTVSVGYLLYLPRGYGQDRPDGWPLILFLHGSDERGDDPQALRRNGLPQALDQGLELPALVLSPQCPLGIRWWQWTEALGALLDQIESEYPVDTGRVYLTGFSMGAYGAWALALRSPERFAAMVPVSGGCDFRDDSIPEDICNLKDLPVWVLHGAQDAIVAPRESENAVNALRACGGDVQFTLYPDADHVKACELAYADRALYDWLFSRLRKSQKTSEVWTTKHKEG